MLLDRNRETVGPQCLNSLVRRGSQRRMSPNRQGRHYISFGPTAKELRHPHTSSFINQTGHFRCRRYQSGNCWQSWVSYLPD